MLILRTLLASLIHLLLAVKRLTDTLKQTIGNERHEVPNGEFLLLADDCPIQKSFKLFNQFAKSLTLIYGTLKISLDQYSVAVFKK